jgi:Na+-translocating ferredoxin:NAD+ oxidoreductase subunit C
MINLFAPRRGVPVPEKKELTAHKPTIDGPDTSELVFPMSMHIGAPAEIVVDVGDTVEVGTLIGDAQKTVSANIHSSVSGKVKTIEERETFKGKSQCVVIENDGKYTETRLDALDESISIDTFLERLSDAGITGKGGAGFPTHVKLSPTEKGHKYILVNGAECEPYSTADHRVMVEHTSEILRTVNFLHHLFEIEKTIIAIEDNKPDAIQCFEREIKKNGYRHIQLHKVESRYPQGDQGVLLKTVLNLEIPEEDNANDVGLISSNVSTVKAIHDAVFEGKPLTTRVITVTGPALTNPQNIRARIGTPVQELIDACGGFSGETERMISGGPMMGKPFKDTSIPVAKDTTTLLFLPADPELGKSERPCIRCAKCIDACPVYLQPILISNAYREERWDLCKVLKAETCINCGCCTYICPSKIPLLEDIKKAVSRLEEIDEEKEEKEKEKKENHKSEKEQKEGES